MENDGKLRRNCWVREEKLWCGSVGHQWEDKVNVRFQTNFWVGVHRPSIVNFNGGQTSVRVWTCSTVLHRFPVVGVRLLLPHQCTVTGSSYLPPSVSPLLAFSLHFSTSSAFLALSSDNPILAIIFFVLHNLLVSSSQLFSTICRLSSWPICPAHLIQLFTILPNTCASVHLSFSFSQLPHPNPEILACVYHRLSM